MKPDTSNTEADAADYAQTIGAHEHIGDNPGDQTPSPWFTQHLGPDPWLPHTCPRCGDETRAGMSETCPMCGYRNWGES